MNDVTIFLLLKQSSEISWQTILALVIIGVLVIGALIKYIVDKKKGKKCTGGCSGCAVSNCPSKMLFNIKEEEQSLENQQKDMQENQQKDMPENQQDRESDN